jgi:hypothetical protein
LCLLAFPWILLPSIATCIPDKLLGANYYDVGDDYYYFVRNAATLSAPLTAQKCDSGCTIAISRALAASCSTWEVGCAIRIGGTDVLPVASFTGNDAAYGVFWTLCIVSCALGCETIEVVANGHQSQDNPLKCSVAGGNCFMWGTWFAAMGIDLGTPDSTYGFQYPCKGTGGTTTGMYTPQVPPNGCLWKAGASVSDDSCGSSGYYCGDVSRRDFNSPIYGKEIVLVRGDSYQNGSLWSPEWDTWSNPIALPGTYYPLRADGTFGAATTSVRLRGGESVILVSRTGAAPARTN